MADASQRRSDKSAQMGYCVCVHNVDEAPSADSVVAFGSSKLADYVNSTAETELRATKDAIRKSVAIIRTVQALYGGDNVKLKVYTDNSAALGAGRKGYSEGGISMNLDAEYVKEELDILGMEYEQCSTKDMLADDLTKWVSGKLL